ncbi:MAG: UbiA family prenyltransferase [Ferruginibacter sp.]
MQKSTLQLLRFHFSFFLMPVYWFALSQVENINTGRAMLIFIIFHFLLYPASNAYNSYMDRDTGSIGGIKNPLPPTRELFIVSLVLDAFSIALSLTISIYFTIGIVAYILASRAYSYRGIRLKQFPFLGYFTVILFQGAVCYYLVKHGSSESKSLYIESSALVSASLLIGGFYPLTQIYQHEQDKADGVRSISAVLGYQGTFTFTAIVYALAMFSLAWYFANNLELNMFFILQIFLLPVLVYFSWWFYQVYRNKAAANFKNTMRMNILASACSNAAFFTIFILEKI